MTPRFVRLADVCARLAIDAQFVSLVTAEGLLQIKHTVEDEDVISAEDAERLRLISLLMRDMDVNLAGVEVILHMHDDLCSMQRQFDQILHTLVDELRRRVGQ